MFRKLLTTSDDWTLTLLRLIWGWCFFRTGHRRPWAGSAAMAFPERWASSLTRSMFPPSLRFWRFARNSSSLGLIAGALGRVAAFGIACNMVVAVLTVHLPNGFFMNWTGQQKGEGFEYHLLAIAIAVVLMARGSGPWSVDRVLAEEQG